MQKFGFVQGLFQSPKSGKLQIGLPGKYLITVGAVLAAAITGATAQESGMPTQSGGQEPEMPGNPTPASPKSSQPGNGSPQMLEAEENGVRLSITCANNQPAKDCAAAATKMLERWQGN